MNFLQNTVNRLFQILKRKIDSYPYNVTNIVENIPN